MDIEKYYTMKDENEGKNKRYNFIELETYYLEFLGSY